jgi:hypothetical protein
VRLHAEIPLLALPGLMHVGITALRVMSHSLLNAERATALS